MKQALHIIKIGGNIIDNEDALEKFLDDFSALDGLKILVHGGGKLATRLSEKLAIPTVMHDGRRVTDEETLKLVTMVYAGWINKHIVAQLQQRACNAIGLSGADANVIPAVKRASQPVDFGWVGDVYPAQINCVFLRNLLGQHITPVFCAITHDQKGNLLNSNADTVASSLAVAMSNEFETSLIYCFEKDGVQSNPDDDDSIILEITRETYQKLKAKSIISGGMIPKIDNAYKAIDAGVERVVIKHAKNLTNHKGTIVS
ncbi:MAG: acetylglutamate kinase [Bacteroidales bacterium]|jgi:acetylglutamate kinase|nr:acetylglutamate kinase [Bacteroidales bacterium]